MPAAPRSAFAGWQRRLAAAQDAHLCQRRRLSKRDCGVLLVACLRPRLGFYATDFKGVLLRRRGVGAEQRRAHKVPPISVRAATAIDR
jgi:hypothetical protein